MDVKKQLIFIISIIFIFLFGLAYKILNISPELTQGSNILTKTNEKVFVEKLQAEENIEPEAEENIFVYIAGEVVSPDVYKLKSNSRMIELVEAAGGFTESAETKNINLAQKLVDEQYVYVPKLGDDLDNFQNNPIANNTTNGKIDINTADKQTLMEIPSIGETLSQSIIDYRETNGKFMNIEELKNVDRIGDKTFERIREYVFVK